MKRLVLCAGILLAAIAAHAQTTKPIRYTWIADACPTWNCAAAVLILANGAPGVIVLPTNTPDQPWVVLKRVEEGSIYVPEDAPFRCEVFDDFAVASARYNAIDSCRAPMILNVPDGRTLITSLQKCSSGTTRRRAVR